MLLLIDLLCYYFTKWRIFYWIAAIMIICYLSVIAFSIGTLIGIYLQEVMTMSKEMERLKSKIEFYKALINLFEGLNLIHNSNDYDNIIEENQKELTEIYKKLMK